MVAASVLDSNAMGRSGCRFGLAYGLWEREMKEMKGSDTLAVDRQAPLTHNIDCSFLPNF